MSSSKHSFHFELLSYQITEFRSLSTRLHCNFTLEVKSKYFISNFPFYFKKCTINTEITYVLIVYCNNEWNYPFMYVFAGESSPRIQSIKYIEF